MAIRGDRSLFSSWDEAGTSAHDSGDVKDMACGMPWS